MVKIGGKKGYALFFFTGLCIGIIAGIIGITILVSYRIDNYYNRISQLETVIEEKEARLKQLEKSINKNRFILEDIEVNLETDEDELDKLTLRKSIKEKYASLIGKEVENINIDLTVGVIEGRIFKLNNKEYKLSVNKIALTNILRIWVKVEPIL